LIRLYSPVRHSLALKNGADPPGGRVTISPSLRAKRGRGAKPQADSTSTSRHTSNAKCLGELSTLCPLATSTTLNSRNRTNLPVAARQKANHRRRIVQFKMPITTTKLSKNDLERLYQARAPPVA